MSKRSARGPKGQSESKTSQTQQAAQPGDGGESVEVHVNGTDSACADEAAASRRSTAPADDSGAAEGFGAAAGGSNGGGATGVAAEAGADSSSADSSAGGADTADTAESESGDTLRERLEAAEREASENYDRFLRTQAGLENLRKRHQRELAERTRYEGEMLIRDLLAVVDDLERALEHTGGEEQGLAEGVKLVYSGLLAALTKHGVERVEAEGCAFDPKLHEAVGTVETSDVEPNTVVQAHRAGYLLRDRLIRPAMVVVAKPPRNSED